jgi:hypothetical protein
VGDSCDVFGSVDILTDLNAVWDGYTVLMGAFDGILGADNELRNRRRWKIRR